MPGLDGIDATREVLAVRPATKVCLPLMPGRGLPTQGRRPRRPHQGPARRTPSTSSL
ncbi:hypothetical protein E3N86_07420 [Cryobacterium sp. Hz7]|uniref:Response regulator n=1 Tax=Cryobacterium sandaracinum TaxID=1259247 RepID=A0ABY2J508_9MICO|nr:hypothetical protein E3N86_07420 [Cryobacterium sp. Hz7]TFC99964.1 hypothetical protein E3T25_13790 [Cryobacterium sandaracinum]